MLIYVNDRLVPAEEATIPVEDRGFRYGDGVFETIAVHGGTPYQWDFHRARLESGLQALRIPFDTVRLFGFCNELLHRNRLENGLLRIAVSRGSGSAGYLPKPSGPPTLVIETLPVPEPKPGPVDLWLSTVEKISPKALPVQCKLAQGVNSTLARLQAEEHKCFDGLQLNAAGHLCETSSANLFWLAGGKLYTPALSCGVLNGSTRHALLRLSPWPVEECVAGVEVLERAEAVLLCNVAIQVLPVKSLQPKGWQWESVATAQQLLQVLQEDIARDTKDIAAAL